MLDSMTPSDHILSFSNELQKIAARRQAKMVAEALGFGKKGPLNQAKSREARRVRNARRKERKQVPVGPLQTQAKNIRTPATTPAQLNAAEAVARDPRGLKVTPMGSQVGPTVGRGGEGIVDRVIKPNAQGNPAIQARKVYDDQGLTSPEIWQRKHEVGKAMGKNPVAAEYYGQARSPTGASVAQFSELIPAGKPVIRTKGLPTAPASTVAQNAKTIPNAKTVANPAPINHNIDLPTGVDPKTRAGMQQAMAMDDAAVNKTKAQFQQASARAGYADPQDVRRANMIIDARTGKHRVVDAIPARKGEFMSQVDRQVMDIPENAIATQNMWGRELGGEKLLGAQRGMPGRSTAEVRRAVFGKSKTHKPQPASAVAPTGAVASGKGRAVDMPQATKAGRPAQQPLAARQAAGAVQNSAELGTAQHKPLAGLAARKARMPPPPPPRRAVVG